VENHGTLHASMPLARKKTFAGTEIYMPPFTQFLGPNLILTSSTYRDKLNEELELLETLQKQIGPFDAFLQRWNSPYQNWLPFYWNGFQQTTRYTYVLEDLSDEDFLWKGFNENIRRQVKKAQGKFTIEESMDDEGFLKLLHLNFQSKKMRIPYDENVLQRLLTACRLNKKILLLVAKENEKVAASIFVALDHNSAYYIIGGKDPAFGSSGAMSALFFHAFGLLREKVKQFNFEGSMIPGVEKFFRSFGAIQKPYFEISKINSLLMKTKYAWLRR
jgi:hypothetical protein